MATAAATIASSTVSPMAAARPSEIPEPGISLYPPSIIRHMGESMHRNTPKAIHPAVLAFTARKVLASSIETRLSVGLSSEGRSELWASSSPCSSRSR